MQKSQQICVSKVSIFKNIFICASPFGLKQNAFLNLYQLTKFSNPNSVTNQKSLKNTGAERRMEFRGKKAEPEHWFEHSLRDIE